MANHIPVIYLPPITLSTISQDPHHSIFIRSMHAYIQWTNADLKCPVRVTKNSKWHLYFLIYALCFLGSSPHPLRDWISIWKSVSSGTDHINLFLWFLSNRSKKSLPRSGLLVMRVTMLNVICFFIWEERSRNSQTKEKAGFIRAIHQFGEDHIRSRKENGAAIFLP